MKLICICGGSGSGKTALARTVQSEWAPDVVVVSTDSYYRDFSGIKETERGDIDFDSPDSFDGELCRAHMRALLRGEPISLPRYDFSRHLRVGAETVQPKPYIVLEGIFSFHDEELVRMASLRVFLGCPLPVMKDRRVRRDVAERGRTVEEVEWRFANHVAPAYEKHILPTAAMADIVLSTGEAGDGFASIVRERIRPLLAG